MNSPRSLEGQLCSNCHLAQLEVIRVDDSFDFLSEYGMIRVHALDVPFEVCPACGERLSGPETAKVHHEAICKVLELLTPDEIRAVRDRLAMSQAEFSKLTGIGEATISRWERGRLLQNRANDRYLRLLAERPENVQFLESLPPPVLMSRLA